jgi:hypothetical protein
LSSFSEHFQAGKDPLSELIQKAIQAKELQANWKIASGLRHSQGIAASKIILVGGGEGKPVSLHSGLVKCRMATEVAALKPARPWWFLRGPPKRLKCMPRCWRLRPEALTSMARPITPSPGLREKLLQVTLAIECRQRLEDRATSVAMVRMALSCQK